MRDLIFTMFMVPLLGLAGAQPFVGVLLWSWISFMNPHQLLWGFASTLPWAAIVFVVTVFGCVIAREPKRLQVNTLTVLMLLMMVGITLTSVTALAPPAAVWSKWDRVFKILLGLLLTAALLDSRRRVHALIWLIVLSLGYFGVKGGIFTLVTGGGYIVMGPPRSMITDRNQLATGLLVAVPLINYLRLQSRHRAVQIGLLAAMVLTLFAAIGSQSRGALVGLAAVVVMFWLRSRGKIISGAALVTVVAVILAFMPESWEERMTTILDPQAESSANSRLLIWSAIWKIARARPLVGGGFRASYQQDIINMFAPGTVAYAAHSIWFEALGEHGFVVFAIWLGMMMTGIVYSIRITRTARDHPHLRWTYDLARMAQVSIVAFMAAGSFVSLAYWDCFWTLIVALGATYRLVVTAPQQAPQQVAGPTGSGWRLRTAAVGPDLATARNGVRL